jgi:uncharacterized membrane protein HdeD (DUF308 family)
VPGDDDLATVRDGAGNQLETGALMKSGDDGPQLVPGAVMAQSWQATVIFGAVTLVLGIIVSFHPAGSLNVVAVLLGILMICSGLFHLARIFGRGEVHRIWLGISGLLLLVIGLVLIRHLHLTTAIIGLYVGLSWVVQGVTALIAGIAGDSGEGRGWWIAFGTVSVIAGIVVTATPVSSLTVLAVLLGIWFVIIGLVEIFGGIMLRRAARTAETPLLGPAGRAVGTAGQP